jgi:hypothetical protein
MVGSYLGLQPKQSESGDSAPQLGISKAGNSLLRRLLVQAAQYILGPLASDSRLRRWGWSYREEAGKTARSGRSLPWLGNWQCCCTSYVVSGEVYDPLHGLAEMPAQAI